MQLNKWVRVSWPAHMNSCIHVLVPLCMHASLSLSLSLALSLSLSLARSLALSLALSHSTPPLSFLSSTRCRQRMHEAIGGG